MSELKKCPYCGEEILAEAKKCKHCREWLTDLPADATCDNYEYKKEPNEIGVNSNTASKESQPIFPATQQPVVNVYTMAPQEPKKEKNGIGLTGFILSILCLVTSWAPGVNIAMWLLGFVFSAVGVFRKPKGFAIAGLVISMISIVLILLLFAVLRELALELFEELGI